MSKYYGLFDGSKTSRLDKALNSAKMREFEKSFPVLAEQARLLTFGAILTVQNLESCQTFRLNADKAAVIEALASSWGVCNREDAQNTLGNLSDANNHTPFADDVYTSFVIKRNFLVRGEDMLGKEDLQHWEGFENAFLITVKRSFDTINPDILTEEERKKFNEDVINHLWFRINEGLSSYLIAKEMLLDFGLTENEVTSVRSTAAWDLGRTSIIARWCVKAGYIEENEMWDFLNTAAEKAIRAYGNWREYLAGYVFGRALGYGSDSVDIRIMLHYLLNHKNSPFQKISF